MAVRGLCSGLVAVDLFPEDSIFYGMTSVDLKTIGYTYKSRSVSNRVWNGVASGLVNLLTEKLCQCHGGAA